MRGVIIAIPIAIVLWLLIVVGVWAATSESTDDGTGSGVERCEEDMSCRDCETMGNKVCG